MLHDFALRGTEPVDAELLERLEQQRLGLGVAALRRPHERNRELRRRERDPILWPDGLPRLERSPLGLVEPALLDEHHRKRPLRLTEVAAVAESLERAHSAAQDHL